MAVSQSSFYGMYFVFVCMGFTDKDKWNMSFDLVKGCDSRHLDHFREHTLSINIKRNKHTHFLESNTKLKSIHQQQHNTTQLQLNVLYSCFLSFIDQ